MARSRSRSRTTCSTRTRGGRSRTRSPSTTTTSRSRAPSRSRSKSVGRKRTKTSLFQKAKQNIDGVAGAGTFTTFSIRKPLKPWLKGLKKAGATSTYSTNGSSSFSAVDGKQVYQQLTTLYASTDINEQIRTIQPRSQGNASKFLLEACQMVMYFTNQSNAPVSLDIYDCVPRRDQAAANSTQSNLPVVQIEAGIETTNLPDGLPSGFAFYNAVLGTSPFQSPLFVTNWKVMKVSKIQLPQGGTHEHRVHVDANKMITLQMLQDGNEYWRNLSYNSFAVAHGFPANNTAGNVSCAGCKIDWIRTQKYEFTSIADSDNNTIITNGLPDPGTITEQVINIGSGAVVNVAAA
nr:MAG: capsid protein [Cressdnaviricota sp.]